MHTYTYTYIHIYIHACMHAYTRIYIHISINTISKVGTSYAKYIQQLVYIYSY